MRFGNEDESDLDAHDFGGVYGRSFRRGVFPRGDFTDEIMRSRITRSHSRNVVG